MEMSLRVCFIVEEDSSNWPIEDIEVKFTASSGEAKAGQLGSIVSVDTSTRKCTVTLNDNGSKVVVPFDSMEPVRPTKKDPVKVLFGEHRGGIGAFIGVDGTDCILRLNNQGTGFKFVNINAVGKYTGTENVMD